MKPNASQCQPHAVLDLSVRPQPTGMLENGTDSGGIAHLALPNHWMLLEPAYLPSAP